MAKRRGSLLPPAARGGCAVAKNLEISYLLDFYGKVLTDKQRDVMEQYYNDDLSLAEIADNVGISRQGVRDAIKRGEATLLELEEKVGFAGRYREVRESLARIEDLAKDIRFGNEETYLPSDKIARETQERLSLVEKISE